MGKSSDRHLAVVLAAGEGTRMKSKKAKLLHRFLGKTIIWYVIDSLRSAGISRICVVIGRQGDVIRDRFAGAGIEFVHQEERLGTGHAVQQARSQIDQSDIVLVTCGDVPLVRESTYRQLLDSHMRQGPASTILTAIAPDPTGYGRIVRNDAGKPYRIVEHRDTSAEEKKIREMNVGIYCFNAPDLSFALNNLKNDNDQGEFYLTDAIEILVSQGKPIEALVAENFDEMMGINNRVQLAGAAKILRVRKNETLMLGGVTFQDPASTYVDWGVSVGNDTVLYPGTVIEGDSCIGSDVLIGPCCHIVSSTIEDGVTIEGHSYIRDKRIGKGSRIEPFSRLP